MAKINVEELVELMEERMKWRETPHFTKEEIVSDDKMVVTYYVCLFFEYVHYKCGHTQIKEDHEGPDKLPVVKVVYTVDGPVYTVNERVVRYITYHKDSEGNYDFGYFSDLHKDHACPYCERKEVKEKFIEESSPKFKGMVFDHGLAAYRGCRSSREIASAVSNIISHPEWELCVTEQYDAPSPYGISVTGCLTGLYKGDVWSEVEEGGERLPAPEHADDIIRDPETLDRYIQYGYADYFEGFMKEVKIEAIWVRRHFCRHIRTARVLRDLAKELGVPLHVY